MLSQLQAVYQFNGLRVHQGHLYICMPDTNEWLLLEVVRNSYHSNADALDMAFRHSIPLIEQSRRKKRSQEEVDAVHDEDLPTKTGAGSRRRFWQSVLYEATEEQTNANRPPPWWSNEPRQGAFYVPKTTDGFLPHLTSKRGVGVILDFQSGTIRLPTMDDACTASHLQLIDGIRIRHPYCGSEDSPWYLESTNGEVVLDDECDPVIALAMDQWWGCAPELIRLVLDTVLTHGLSQEAKDGLVKGWTSATSKLTQFRRHAKLVVKAIMHRLLRPPPLKLQETDDGRYDQLNTMLAIVDTCLLTVPAKEDPEVLAEQQEDKEIHECAVDANYVDWLGRNNIMLAIVRRMTGGRQPNKAISTTCHYTYHLLAWFLAQRRRLSAHDYLLLASSPSPRSAQGIHKWLVSVDLRRIICEYVG